MDEGSGPPIVLLHGEPGWSFIWRRMIPPLRDAGYRCVAPDHAGFGRSDKPLDPAWQTAERHVAITASLLDELDLREVTLVVHDWGGPIGLTLALAHPERVARVVILDTTLDHRDGWKSETWVRFRELVERTSDLAVGELMRFTFATDPGDEVVAAYDAPFPTPESTAAARGLPMAVPAADDEDAATALEGFYAALRELPTPMLMIWGAEDRFLNVQVAQRLATAIGRPLDHVLPGAGHGVPEDKGPEVAELIIDWLGEGLAA